jgi:hypothetical protein
VADEHEAAETDEGGDSEATTSTTVGSTLRTPWHSTPTDFELQ